MIVNDLGAVTYYTQARILDLAALGDIEPLEIMRRTGTYTSKVGEIRGGLGPGPGYGRAVSGLVWAQAFAWRRTERMALGIARRTTGERASPMPKRSPAMLRTTALGARP